MTIISEQDFLSALNQCGGPKCADLSKDPKLFKATFDIVRGLGATDTVSKVVAVSAGVTSMVSTAGKYSALDKGRQNELRAASMAMSTFKASMDLVKVTRLTSVGAVVAYVGAAGVQKTGLAVSLVGGDDERAKCLGAVMELAGSAVTTTLVAPTGVLAVLAAASLAASAMNAYAVCKDLARP